MSKERLEKLINGILEVSKVIGLSIDEAENKLVEGIGTDVMKTAKIMEVVEKFNRTRTENLKMIKRGTSRAKRLIQVIEAEDTSASVTMRDLKDSIKAHNAKREEAGANDAYNRSKGLGTWNGRALVGMIARDKSGNPTDKVSMNDAIAWAHAQIPQQSKPYFQDVIRQLQSTEHPKTGSTINWKTGEACEAEGKMYRVEGKKKGKTEWELIFRTKDLIIADKAADKYRDQYAAVRVGEETPGGGLKPIKGRSE